MEVVVVGVVAVVAVDCGLLSLLYRCVVVVWSLLCGRCCAVVVICGIGGVAGVVGMVCFV